MPIPERAIGVRVPVMILLSRITRSIENENIKLKAQGMEPG
jgi:hypothetical protein